MAKIGFHLNRDCRPFKSTDKKSLNIETPAQKWLFPDQDRLVGQEANNLLGFAHNRLGNRPGPLRPV